MRYIESTFLVSMGDIESTLEMSMGNIAQCNCTQSGWEGKPLHYIEVNYMFLIMISALYRDNS